MPAIETIPAREAAGKLEGWAAASGREAIVKAFRFRDFKEAWGFMSRVALRAEQMDHHPEWTNIYNRVEVVLTTHEASGVTERDLALARYLDACS